MNKISGNTDNIQERNFFDYLSEITGWILIVVSFLVLTAIPAIFIYISNPSVTRFLISIAIASIGLLGGIIYATKIWKTKGIINLISRVSASPELDDMDND